MPKIVELEKVSISAKAHKQLQKLLRENPELENILENAESEKQAFDGLRNIALTKLQSSPQAMHYYKNKKTDRDTFEALSWTDLACIRILDYIDNAGREFVDLNLRGEITENNPFKLLWLAVRSGMGGGRTFFFDDMIELFRQFSGTSARSEPNASKLQEWMDRYPSGLEENIIKIREENRERILNLIIEKIDAGIMRSSIFKFSANQTKEKKLEQAKKWWTTKAFHLHFVIRTPELLNEMLGFSLSPETMKILKKAEKVGIPFFVNPYYLSLLNVKTPKYAAGADYAIRSYVIYSEELIEEFGNIVAWEKEDLVEPGKPNAAGWLLPSLHNIHRRYSEVAILIPDTVGRACGGLCTSCQRMYDFQSGHLNFNLDKLKPRKTWPEKLKKLMDYYETDSQLRDILITGGDALMSTDVSLKKLLDEIYNMAVRKREANKNRKDGEKYAEILRIRLGTRLPVYLPQRITPELMQVLSDFKERASKIGIKQFFVATHFESPMEITPESKESVERLTAAGWTVINQHVFTAASSRRGHTAKLRQVLNDIGVLPYYTFTVKGYKENKHNFATNARAVQEQIEEKAFGKISKEYFKTIKDFPLDPENLVDNIANLRKNANLMFLATDRNVLNLPGVGKSLTFRTIGLTHDGRRIIEFDHDETRNHSPIIEKMGKVAIIESKSIMEYLTQLDEMGEDKNEYKSVYGYSVSRIERRLPLFRYPKYNYNKTSELTNIQID